MLIVADRLNNLKPTTPDDCQNAILPQGMWILIPKQRAPAKAINAGAAGMNWQDEYRDNVTYDMTHDKI